MGIAFLISLIPEEKERLSIQLTLLFLVGSLVGIVFVIDEELKCGKKVKKQIS